MKESILALIISIICNGLSAQTVTFADYNGNLFPDIINIELNIDTLPDVDLTTYLLSIPGNLKNFTTEAQNIAIKREIVDNIYVNDSVQVDVWGALVWKHPEDLLCWGITCEILSLDDLEYTTAYTDLNANQEITLEYFIHYTSLGLLGTTSLKYSILKDTEVLDELIVNYVIKNEPVVNISKDDAISIGIYPNPFDQHINIYNTKDIKQLTMSNSLGQVILTTNVNQSTYRISTEKLPKGIYFIRLFSKNNQVFAKKVIKQ